MLCPADLSLSTHFLRFVQSSECEWIAVLRVTRGTHQFSLDFLSKWLEISLRAIARGFESLPLRQKEKRHRTVSLLFLFRLLPLLIEEAPSQQRRGVEERGGEDDERKIALHLVARRRKALDEQVAEKIARGDQREMAEHFADLFPAAEEKCNTERNKKGK